MSHAGLRRPFLGLAVAALAVAASACTEAPEPTVPSTEGERLDALLDALPGLERLRAVIVVDEGEVVADRYLSSTGDDYWDIRSVTKSLTSTLIGVAIDDGLIPGVDATLGDLLPAYADVLTPETALIPLHSVLTHTANFAADAAETDALLYATPDPVRAVLTDRAVRGPGDGSFGYSDAGSHVLAAVVAQASGMTPLAFAAERVFDPLGIPVNVEWETPARATEAELAEFARTFEDASFAWVADPTGIHYGNALIKLRAADLARIGALFLDDGMWDGQRVVSSEWITEATRMQVESTDSTAYGYQWWADLEGERFSARGAGGTIVAVDRARNAVVVLVGEIEVLENGEEFGLLTVETVDLLVDTLFAGLD